MSLRVLDIVEGTSVDGVGLRTSIYFAGCSHRCPGCHNPQSWDAEGGRPMEIDEIMEIVADNDYNVTFSGGDPFYQVDELVPLARAIREHGYGIWCYTGYTYESICTDAALSRLLPYLDVLVDGPFINDRRDINLLFRGSDNQRLIDVRMSNPGNVVLWHRD
ncbi:MAG: anaerobic ribonucleoside-triphosphate reductase activating protein [Pseudoflavonifractor sp.]|nr:anaerobic ribonucleoside-triphosphate reductase activating protein [Pseudoflavonifractor sp.]